MNKIIPITALLLFLSLLSSAQKPDRNNVARPLVERENPSMPYKMAVSECVVETSDIIGSGNNYDLLSNWCMSNRFYRYPDGHLAATWTGSREAPSFSDRGSFYNYFDGQSWEYTPEEVQRVENVKRGWPSYIPYGEQGEAIFSHGNSIGMWTRQNRGTGEWQETIPSLSDPAFSTPRACNNNGTIHLLYNHLIQNPKPKVSHIYYARSTDNGASWDPLDFTIDLIGPDFYNERSFESDSYVWAEPNNGVIAFALTSRQADLVIMKSTDNGDSWEKIIPWHHPVPFFDYEYDVFADTLYCPNGAISLTIDDSGMCHIVFAVCKYNITADGKYYYPNVGHLMYWNEDMDSFDDSANQWDALDPEMHPDYMTDGRCVLAYGFDFDGDGKWYSNGDISYYLNVGTIQHVGMVKSGPDRMIIAVSCRDEQFVSVDGFLYNRIFLCSYLKNSQNGEWNFDDNWVEDPNMAGYNIFTGESDAHRGWYRMVSGIIHSYDECIYPQLVSQQTVSDKANFYVFYNVDDTPGDFYYSSTSNPQHGKYTDNSTVMWANSRDFSGATFPERNWDGIEDDYVSDLSFIAFPNPAHNNLTISSNEDVSIFISDVLGRNVRIFNHISGMETIDISYLESGIYFVTARSREQSQTLKIIVK